MGGELGWSSRGGMIVQGNTHDAHSPHGAFIALCHFVGRYPQALGRLVHFAGRDPLDAVFVVSAGLDAVVVGEIDLEGFVGRSRLIVWISHRRRPGSGFRRRRSG